MSEINIKINLASLKSVQTEVTGKEGKKVPVIIIPILENHLFKSDKGNVYLDAKAFELKTKREDSKDTHIIKQSLPKDVYQGMSEEEKRAMPVLGNATLWGGGGHAEKAPEVAESLPTDVEISDDLPF